MVRSILYVGLCLLLFASGLGLAVVLGVNEPPPATPAEEPVTDLVKVVPSDPLAEFKSPDGVDPAVLPVPVRGEPLSVEELFRFGAMYREQQQLLVRREEEIQRRQSRLKLLQNDVVGSRQEFDGLRAQIEDTANQVKESISQLREQQQVLQQQQQEAKSEQQQGVSGDDVNASESLNLKQISAWFQSMPAEKAAEYLRELSNDGNMDSAVKLLGEIEERIAAKILAAMEDPTLVVEITEAFRQAKRPEMPKRKRR